MKKLLLAYQISGQTVSVDILTWNNIDLSGNEPFISINDGDTIPTNYIEISSIENWIKYGEGVFNLLPEKQMSEQVGILINEIGFNSLTSMQLSAITGQTDSKIDKVINATGNLAIFVSDGNVEDSGVTIDSITGGTGFYFYIDKSSNQSTTSNSNVVYLTNTSSILTAGTWSIDFNAIGGNQNNNRSIIVGFYLDNILQGVEIRLKTNSSTTKLPFVITKDLNLTNATHTFEIRFRQAGGGTAFLDYGSVRARIVN